MGGEPFDAQRLRSAPVASIRPMSTSPSGDDSDGSGRHSSFGFQPQSPSTAAQSRRTGSTDALDVTRDGSRFGFQKRPSHTRSASTGPTWHTEYETRPKSSFAYQSQQHNTPQPGASPSSGTELSGAKPRSSFGYQPRQLRRVGKACESRDDGDNGEDEAKYRKNFGYQPRRQETSQVWGDTGLKNRTNDVVKLGDSTAGQNKEQSAPDEGLKHCISGVQQKPKGTASEENPQLLSEQEDAPIALPQDGKFQRVGICVQEELPGKTSPEGCTPVACGQRMASHGQEVDSNHHRQLSFGAGSVGAQPMHAAFNSGVDNQSNLALGDDDDDCVRYEYTAPHAEEVAIKHPCMADQPTLPPGAFPAMSPQDGQERLKRAEELCSGNRAKCLSRTPESQVALQYANELLDSTPQAGAPKIAPTVSSAEESTSDEEIDVAQGEFPFSYMEGFKPTWLDSGSESGSEQTRAYARTAENEHTAAADGGGGHCPIVQVKGNKEKYKSDEMDLDSSSDDYVLEETDVVLQNLLSDQSAPRTPSVEEGRRSVLQASNLSARSTLTGSPSVDSQREEAALLLQKLMTRSSMTSRSAEEDVNSPYDRRGATRMSLLSRSSGRSGGWDEPMEGSNEEGDEESSDDPGIEAALQKLMVSVHRMNEEVRDGSTAEKTVSSWLQEDKQGVEAKAKNASDVADAKLKSVGADSTMEAVVLDGSVQGALQELQQNCVDHPIVLGKLSGPCSKDTSTVDHASVQNPVSSAGHTTRGADEHSNPCPTMVDMEVGEMVGHGALQEISVDADDQAELTGEVAQSGKAKDMSVVLVSMQGDGEEFACDVSQVEGHGALQDTSFDANHQAVLVEEATQSGMVKDVSVAPIPTKSEGEEIDCDVVMLTARDIVDASAPTAACNEQWAPSPGLDHASSGSISGISENLSVDGGCDTPRQPMDISLHLPTKEPLAHLSRDSDNANDHWKAPTPVDAQPTTVSGAVAVILGEERDLEASSHLTDPPCASSGVVAAVASDEDGDCRDSACLPSPTDVQPATVTSAAPEAMEEDCDCEPSPSPVAKPPCVAMGGLHPALNKDGDDNGSRQRSPSPMDVHAIAAPGLTHGIASEESDREASPPPMDIRPYVATKGLSAIFNEDGGDDSDDEDSPISVDELVLTAGIAPEVMGSNSGSGLSPLPNERDLAPEQPDEVGGSEASPEPRTPDSIPLVHRRAMDLPLHFDTEWMAASCLATMPRTSNGSSETSHSGPICVRYRGFSCDRGLILNYDEEDYVLARAAAASRMSVDFADVAFHPPRTSFSTFSFAASADPAINKRLPCTRLMRRRLDLVMRMQEQWHFGRRPAEWRRCPSDFQKNRSWAQPVLRALSSPIRGISHVGNGIVSKIANVFGFGKAGQ